MIQSEIQSILLYAVRWNGVQESAAAKRDILDAWRQVTEVLLISAPPELLPSSSKKQILLQLLQTLLNKVGGEDSVAGLEGLVSSAVLLLLTSLRGTYENTPDKKTVMGETFVGILDGTQLEETPLTGQPYSASLQVILRGLISWIIGAGGGSQLIRTNLYAALLAYLRIGKSSGTQDNSAMLELSECGKLHKANLEVVSSYGASFLEVVSRDACAGHEVRRMLALAVLDELVCLDRRGEAVRFLANQGFLKHIIESLITDQPGLVDLLTRQTGNIRDLYVYESKMGVLSRVATSPAGAEMLLQVGVVWSTVPDPAPDVVSAVPVPAVALPRHLPLLHQLHPHGPQDPLQRGQLRQVGRLLRQLQLPHLPPHLLPLPDGGRGQPPW